MAERNELGSAIRAWRERVAPAEAGLPDGGGRRVPGLRREELALLAGISVDYLVRLEQGRSQRPSSQILAALARALFLDGGERELLYRSAGVVPPPMGEVPRELPRGVRVMIDRMDDTPVAVFSAAWDMVESNHLWVQLFGVHDGNSPGRAANLIWQQFATDTRAGRGPRSTVIRDAAQSDAFERELVSDLRRAADRYPDDRIVAELVAALRERSERFTELWLRFETVTHSEVRKTMLHNELGPITFDCDVLSVNGSDLRVVLYTAATGSPDEAALEILRDRARRHDAESKSRTPAL
jgi:transcriptional regulator with XRE-family HTH domain